MEELAVSGVVLAIIVIGGLLYLIFIGYTIYHAIAKNRTENSILWVLLILIFPLIGSIIYWVMYSNFKRSPKRHPR